MGNIVKTKSTDSINDSFLKKIKSLLCFKSLPRGIFAVSLFGLFLGISTTMVYSQLWLFLKYDLGVSEQNIASMDGVIEFISYLTRIFAGAFSDYLGNRKLILLLGCFVTLFVRPFLVFVGSVGGVVAALSVERIGNGLQASPRDALIADLSDKKTYAQSFGFCRSLKTCGALLGTLIAIGVMYCTDNNYKIVFFCATIPVVIAIFCLSMLVSKKNGFSSTNRNKTPNPFKHRYIKSLDRGFWKIIFFAVLFEIGHFSESLIPLRAHDFISTTASGSTGVFTTVGQIAFAYPIGFFADKIGKKYFIKICMLIMFLANVCFLYANSIFFVYLGALLWGCQMSSIQGLFLSIISEHVNKNLLGTAIGIFYCAIGGAYFIASATAGGIWTNYGSSYAFLYSMIVSTISFTMFSLFFSKTKKE